MPVVARLPHPTGRAPTKVIDMSRGQIAGAAQHPLPLRHHRRRNRGQPELNRPGHRPAGGGHLEVRWWSARSSGASASPRQSPPVDDPTALRQVPRQRMERPGLAHQLPRSHHRVGVPGQLAERQRQTGASVPAFPRACTPRAPHRLLRHGHDQDVSLLAGTPPSPPRRVRRAPPRDHDRRGRPLPRKPPHHPVLSVAVGRTAASRIAHPFLQEQPHDHR